MARTSSPSWALGGGSASSWTPGRWRSHASARRPDVFDLAISGGHVFDPGEGIDRVTDVAVADGKIAAVGPGLARDAREVIDASGKDRLVLPGLIDIHAHVARRAT